MQNIRLSYKDEDGDKIEIKVEDDYKLFIEEIKKKKDKMELLVEVKEESDILIKKCSSSILNYVSKNSSLNINNVSEEIKEKRKSLELSDEMDPNNIPNENDKKNINNNIIDNKENNVIVNNPNNNIENEKKDNPMPYKVILDNNINQNNINNINNINNNNNINNINPQNQQVKNPQQPQHQNSQQQSQRNMYLYVLSYPLSCNLCMRGPIYTIMYYCKECRIILCPQCEMREGPRHAHPFYKVQNTSQFEALNLSGFSSMDKFMNDVGNSIEGAYKSVLGFFGANNNQEQNQNQNKKVEVIRRPQWVSLVQIARASYDLRTVTDKQIEEALIKSKGNIDEAVISLTAQ